ncbi:MAG: PilW family protein [Gammaproteobacteria bacterium]|nr:PilW family protein [Gammaproteobacteria bacterium]
MMKPDTQKQSGFSLIELMIAMVIGLLLMAGIISIFAGSRKSFDLTQEISGLQESARFAMESLTNDIRLSGFQGCITAEDDSTSIQSKTAPTSDLNMTATRGAEVNGTSWSPAAPIELSNLEPAPLSGSDVLMIQYGSPVGARLASPMIGLDAPLVLESNAIGLQPGDLAIVSDCDQADLFTVSNVSGNTIQHTPADNHSGNLTKEYSPIGDTPAGNVARVMKFNYITYYVGDSGRFNTQGNPIYSLYAYDLNAINNGTPPTEIIEGVENMQVLYGIRAVNGTVRYVPADDGSFDNSRVHSIQIGLLIASIEGKSDTEDDRTYTLLDTDIVAAGGSSAGSTHSRDRRIRMTFNSTIKIRNRRNQ